MSIIPAITGNVAQTLLGGATSTGAAGGNRTYYGGLPLMLRTNKRATTVNKSNRVLQATPRHKFMFYACFTPGLGAPAGANFQSWQTGFAFQINKVDRVKASPKTQILNQYNRKRSVHTGIDYGDVNLILHDTVDDRVLRVWREYHKWYFGDGRPKERVDWKRTVINGRQDYPVLNGWGFSPQSVGIANNNFFDTLDVYTFYGKKYTQVTFYNPKIDSITFDAMEASATSELSTVDMTIKHEGFAYTQVAAPVSDREIQLFGLNLGDYFEPSDAFGGVNSFLLDLNDQLEDTLDSLLGSVSTIPFVGGVLAGLGSNAVRASGVTGFLPRVSRAVAGTTLSRWGTFR